MSDAFVHPAAVILNRDLEQESPEILAALSPLGRGAVFPPDIPFQAAEARATQLNGTIGVFTDGQGGAVPLPAIAEGLALEPTARDRALLYSPVGGMPDLRRAWRERQRRNQPEGIPSSLPIVTVGLTHGLSLVADLFGGPGRRVAIPGPFWGNYRQTFTLRTGAEVRSEPWITEGRFRPAAIADCLRDLPAGEPAVALVNFPSNPGGYSPTVAERAALRNSLLEIAEVRPLVVLCDDAYAGVVYDDSIPKQSMFWQLTGAHPRLLAVKIDGATKELAFFGGRVGFLTFGVEHGSKTEAALESKAMGLLRATVGSPVAISQMLLLRALESGEAETQMAEIHRISRRRYEAVKPLLDELDPALLRPMPFNAGYFVLFELPAGIDADKVRHHLIEQHSTGVVSITGLYLRLALCSVRTDDLPEMVRRIETGVREMVEA
nr:aspartate aminotransferase-like [Nerophis lumbriciformis]